MTKTIITLESVNQSDKSFHLFSTEAEALKFANWIKDFGSDLIIHMHEQEISNEEYMSSDTSVAIN